MTHEIEIEIMNLMISNGIETPLSVIDDGEVHRFGFKHNSWYIFREINGIIFGKIGDWKLGISMPYTSRKIKTLDFAERKAFFEKRRVILKEEKEKEEAKNIVAAEKCRKIIANSRRYGFEKHAYLVRKKVGIHGIFEHNNNLVIPIYSGKDLTSLQMINCSGEKEYYPGGKIKGCSLPLTEKLTDRVYVAEGYATSATIFELLNQQYQVICAFNAGNIYNVVKRLRKERGNVQVVICADDDYKTKGNPGLSKAKKTAKEFDCFLCIPDFEGLKRGEKDTDFNDLRNLAGSDRTIKNLKQLIKRSWVC